MSTETETVSGVQTQQRAYAYDDASNRTQQTAAGSENYQISYEYDRNNRLMSESKTGGSGGAYTYTYDHNGNQLTKESGGTTLESRQYNGLNQLTGLTAGSAAATYVYNPSGLRAAKTVNGTQTQYILDGENTILELASGSVRKYIRGQDLISAAGGGDTRYYLYNAHGDVTQLTDSAGNIVKSYEYDAFGNEKNPVPSDPNPFRYTGEYFDLSSGTYYLRARSYDPTTGRFLSEDTYLGNNDDPLSLNLYTYCHNNPVRYTDSSGNIPVETFLDAASMAWSAVELWNNPSWANLGFLAWDIGATIVPYAPGSYVAKAGSLFGKADDVFNALKAMSKADKIAAISDGKVMMSYGKLKKLTAWTPLESHHLLEQRFLKNEAFKNLGIDANDIMSAALDKDTHRLITSKMREKIPYDSIWKGEDELTTSTASVQKIWEATNETYTELGLTHLLDPIKETFIKAGATID